MGFLELAAALKFLANTDLAFNPGNGWFFNFETVIGAWIVLSFACGLYLLGLFRLPHDSPVEFLSVPRMVLATIFLGFALYLVPALFHKQPMGKIGEWALAFAPPDTSELPGGTAQGSSEGKLEWTFDYQKARNQALREGKLVFIDFTGVNCTNCRANERNVFTRKEVRQELEKFALVQLYNDSVPDRSLSGAEAKAQADRNEEWQRQTFGDVSTPLYVIFQPDRDEAFEGTKLKGKELGRRAGYISNVPEFVAFLKDPKR
jgi:thiol:disulfide interchange protein DsbD